MGDNLVYRRTYGFWKAPVVKRGGDRTIINGNIMYQNIYFVGGNALPGKFYCFLKSH